MLSHLRHMLHSLVFLSQRSVAYATRYTHCILSQCSVAYATCYTYWYLSAMLTAPLHYFSLFPASLAPCSPVVLSRCSIARRTRSWGTSMLRTACTMGVSMRAITSRGSTIRLLSPPSLPALPLRLRVLSPSPAFQELLLLPEMIKKYIKKLSATHTCMRNANTCAHIHTPGSQRIFALKFPIFWQTFLVSALHHSLQCVACSLGSRSSGNVRLLLPLSMTERICLMQGLCSVKSKTKFQMVPCLIQGLFSVKSKTKFQMVPCLIQGLCSVKSKTKFWMVPSQCLYQQQSSSLRWTKINTWTYDAAAWTGGGPDAYTGEPSCPCKLSTSGRTPDLLQGLIHWRQFRHNPPWLSYHGDLVIMGQG